MTVALEAGELMQWLEVAAAAGTIVTMLLAGLIIYWMVRPPRPPIAPPRARHDEPELANLIDTMERRLALLERDIRDSRLPAQARRRRETTKEGESE